MGNSESSAPETSRPRNGPNIYLNVYVPSNPEQKQVPGFGTYHTGIQIWGKEFFFAGGPGQTGSGVHEQTPKSSPPGSQWTFNEQLDLGKTDLSDGEVRSVLAKSRNDFPASTYNIIQRNCNHFTELMCHRLHVEFPSWVNRAAKLGGMFTGGTGASSVDLVQQDKQREAERKRAELEKAKNRKEMNDRQSNLKQEPPKEALGVIEIQINCPNGTKTKRRFLNTDKIQDVMNFVSAYDLTIPKNSFYLRCNYPKKVFDKPSKTLKDVGMEKRENLFIQMKR